MIALLGGIAWSAIVIWLLLRVTRQFQVHRAASLAVPPETGPLPRVAVVIPARNESGNIDACLLHLLAQEETGGDVTVTVVDDGSTDGTADAVARYMRAGAPVRLVTAGPLPRGWMGKPHACWRGAMASEGEWLCFIDADVRTAPELLRAALAAVEIRGIHMLSLHPLQELGTVWERLVIPAGVLMIACAKDHRGIGDPASPEASANGQFILIRRDAYFAVGGHAGVRDEVCEDKALARRVKESGYHLCVLGAEHLVRTRMYRSLPSLWEGFSKNAIEIVGTAHGTVLAAAGGLIAGWAVPLLPAFVGLAAIDAPSVAAWLGFGFAAVASAIVLAVQAGTLRHFRTSAAYVALFPIGITMAAAIAFHSVFLRLRGQVTWRGRSYELGRSHRRESRRNVRRNAPSGPQSRI